MSADPTLETLAEEEVAFWRGFIAWWVREREGPVPSRAWEALARAEVLCQSPHCEPSALDTSTH